MTYPQDRSLGEVLEAMAEDGFTGQLASVEGGDVRCLTCRDTWPAERLDAGAATRIEGASDPAEMAIVIHATCPVCATKGVLVAQYGPEASAADADVVLAMDRTPAQPEEQR